MYLQGGRWPQPIPVSCADGILWVDKYYVAYQIGNGDVYYTYLSKYHIREEINAYKAASKARGIKLSVPTDILRCFQKAKSIMDRKGTNIWIDPRWEENETK